MLIAWVSAAEVCMNVHIFLKVLLVFTPAVRS